MSTEILKLLRNLDETRGDDIEFWLRYERAKAAPYFTTSVDLRHSGARLTPVDTNLFPAGFNNISPAALERAARYTARFLKERYPDARRIVIIPENHTRNLFYLDNLATLLSIFKSAGIEVELGSLAATAGQPIALVSHSGSALTEYPLAREGKTLKLENGFTPDIIIMNNDMTSGAPELLKSIRQPVTPPIHMGWWQRRKSVHFQMYEQLAESFGRAFDIDPWLICARFHRCGIVDFKQETGLDIVAADVEKLLEVTREKYRQYGISDEPYAYVKAESGTYGMGVMTARSGSELLELNKKARNKMQTIKEGTEVSEVIIQEGIPTLDRVDGFPAEPVIYMIDGVPVGGMYRVNEQRDSFGNLNASGMRFTGICDEGEDECGKWKSVIGCDFRAFGIIAAIAALAAAREDYHVGRDGAGI